MSLLPEKLKTFKYYLEKLPLYLRQSELFIEHFRIWFDLLKSISDFADDTLNALNIFDEHYLENLKNSDVLDKIADLFGLSRNFRVSYKNSDNIPISEELSLTDEDLLILIKSHIIKDYCDGTTSQIEAMYELIGLRVDVLTLTANATCQLVLGKYDDKTNVGKMFLAGLLRIESLGIIYDENTVTISEYLVWDSTTIWDKGWWI